MYFFLGNPDDTVFGVIPAWLWHSLLGVATFGLTLFSSYQAHYLQRENLGRVMNYICLAGQFFF